jgi:hypothetical protein
VSAAAVPELGCLLDPLALSLFLLEPSWSWGEKGRQSEVTSPSGLQFLVVVMADPTRQEITQVFKRLTSMGPNKVSTKIPTTVLVSTGNNLQRFLATSKAN